MFDKSKIKVGATVAAPRIVLIGVEGVGKTTAGAQCPKPIILTAEEGLVGRGFDGVEHYSPSGWTDVLEFLTWLRDNNDKGYESIIVDTIDWLEPHAEAFICARDKKSSLDDYGHGNGYIALSDEFRRALKLLDDIHKKGLLVMITAHCQIKPFSNPSGDNYDRYELKCSKRIGAMVKEWSDAVLFANYHVDIVKESKKGKAKGIGGQVRLVYAERNAAWDAKNRFGLPSVMPFDMPTILEAIKKGEPGSAENIIAEINALAPKLDEEKRKAAADFVTKNAANPLRLSQMLNKIRAIVPEEGE
jgi:hypothetical protein